MDYDDPVDRAAVDERFARRKPTPDQTARLVSLRDGARLYARHVLRVCPPSPERDAALLAVDSALAFAELAIQRRE